MMKAFGGNASRHRLFEKIERLADEQKIARGSMELERKRLDDRKQAELAKLDSQLQKQLYGLELQLVDEETAIDAMLGNKLPALKAAQRLKYRKLRQDLRRGEGLLDRQGKLKPGALMSEAGEQKLRELLARQQAEEEALRQKAREQIRATAPDAQKREALQARFDLETQEKARRIAQLDKSLEQRNAARHAAYSARKQRKVDSLGKAIASLKTRLLESEQQAGLELPQDVCLRLDNLSMAFGGLKAVDQLSFDVKKGEIFGLIGPNGAGKTTVFNCITQFYKPTGGDILYRTGEGNVLSLNAFDVHKIITKGIVRTFQNVEVIGELSILDNLLIAAHPQFHAPLYSQIFNTRRVREEEMVIRERALKVLEYCGLAHLKDVPPLGQPYGVLKRIELARTLMAGANLIILDEPAAGLNDQETIELTRLIRRIQKDYQATIFLVEHNMGLVMDLCDHICAISFGKKLAYGTPAQIQNDPVVQEAYLGTSDKEELEAV